MDEWLRLNRFPLIEFRNIDGERVACVKARLEVWQVVMVAQAHGNDIAATAEHLNLRPEQVESALNYYAAYPHDVDLTLAENRQGFDRLRRILLQPRVHNV